MPRRALLLLTALVLMLHWLLLAGLPLGGTGRGAPQLMALHTRMLAPAPAPAPAPVPAETQPPPAPAPAQRAPRQPKPKAAPRAEAPTIPAPDTPADAASEAPQGPEPSTSPNPATAETQATDAGTEPATPATDMPADTAAKTPAQTPPPTQAEAPADSAGVEILPPGATGASASTQPPPVLLPPSTLLQFDVTGEVKKFHYSASAELLWRQDGARYEARQQIKAFLLGARGQTSVGSITPQGLRPERFGDKARSEQAAHFDYERHEVIFSANTPRATIAAGAQDRLSIFIQLGAMLAAAPERYPNGTQISMFTVGARKADRWSFRIEGPETLDLPAGSTPALKLERVPPAGQQYEQKAELWLGTALHYLPVRIRLTQANGDFVDLLLSGHTTP
ncbi:MAG: DUF3108 domain-containing protein [Proteobacteria bacterium]|nr:DUF3108 domain-containing protein [Pseudomonadota bacterium]